MDSLRSGDADKDAAVAAQEAALAQVREEAAAHQSALKALKATNSNELAEQSAEHEAAIALHQQQLAQEAERGREEAATLAAKLKAAQDECAA